MFLAAKNELGARRLVVLHGGEVREWDLLSETEKNRLAYAWNNAAMYAAGFEISDKKPSRRAVVV